MLLRFLGVAMILGSILLIIRKNNYSVSAMYLLTTYSRSKAGSVEIR